MLTTIDEESKTKLVQEKQAKTLQQLLSEHTQKKFTKDDLIDCEAGIVFLEKMVKDLDDFINLRKNAPVNHLDEVEKRIDELSVIYLERFRKELKTSINAWGRRPFEDSIHEKGIYE